MKILTITVPSWPATFRARSINEACPKWSAPIVGTSTSGGAAERQKRRVAAIERRIFTGLTLGYRRANLQRKRGAQISATAHCEA